MFRTAQPIVIFRSICCGIASMIATLFAWMIGYFVFVPVNTARLNPGEQVGFDLVSLVRNVRLYSTLGVFAFAGFAIGFALSDIGTSPDLSPVPSSFFYCAEAAI